MQGIETSQTDTTFLNEDEIVVLLPFGRSTEPWTVERANKELEVAGNPVRLETIRVIEDVWLEEDGSLGTNTQGVGVEIRTIVGKPVRET